MLAEVQAYIDAVAGAKATYQSASRAHEAAHSEAFSGSWTPELGRAQEAWYVKNKEIGNAFRVAKNTAWAKLSQSENPLVRFIEEHAKNHQADARKILEALPASLEELEQIADNEGFCDVFGQLRDAAVDAGVVPGHSPLSAARKDLRAWVLANSGLYQSQVPTLMAKIEAVVTEALAERDAAQVDHP